MDTIRKTFEALMASKGKTNLIRKGEGYANPNIQTKFRYFVLGWRLSK
jgi:hypothetical protein